MEQVTPSKARIWWEIGIVLALGLGQAAVYSIVQLVYRWTDSTPLSEQTVALNPSRSSRPEFDLVYQLLNIGFSLLPTVLVCFLLWQTARPHLRQLGLDGKQIPCDIGKGLLLVAVVGIPGLALYLTGRVMGLTVAINAGATDPAWWSVPVLLLSALRAALQEEPVILGYLFFRLRQLGWSPWTIIIATSLLRGAYHSYQGLPAFLGNVAMGFLFGWLFTRSGRLLPFITAHWAINSVAFVGYPWAIATWPSLFGVTS